MLYKKFTSSRVFLLCILAFHFVFSSINFCSLGIPYASQKQCYPGLLYKYINYEHFLAVCEPIKGIKLRINSVFQLCCQKRTLIWLNLCWSHQNLNTPEGREVPAQTALWEGINWISGVMLKSQKDLASMKQLWQRNHSTTKIWPLVFPLSRNSVLWLTLIIQIVKGMICQSGLTAAALSSAQANFFLSGEINSQSF